ncbi:cytochrome P450 [Saccharopolyspora hattusasensis]|uniref:cytochrome P450 n=1 Tax=Saccharopolyspora hattusasensis TaxID=1128679 RepID=UPI003D99E90D
MNAELGQYLDGLAEAHARQPGDDLISGLLTDTGAHAPMPREDLLSTAALLLVAGHETTVNLIANGMLTLLRHPDVLDRLRHEPDLITPLVEELLRYQPPVQMLTGHSALTDIDIAGTTIPQGSPLTLMLAAGNRDPHASPTRTASTPTAPTTSTSASPTASTTASAPRWPGRVTGGLA